MSQIEAPGCAHCMGSGKVKPGERCPKCHVHFMTPELAARLSVRSETVNNDDKRKLALWLADKLVGDYGREAAQLLRWFAAPQSALAGAVDSGSRTAVAAPVSATRENVIEECAEAIDGCLKERQPSDFYAAVVRKLKGRHDPE